MLNLSSGIAAYVKFALPDIGHETGNNFYTSADFFLDGEHVGSYSRYEDSILYDTTVFSIEHLTNALHTLVITPAVPPSIFNLGSRSENMFEFDYLVRFCLGSH